MAIAIAIGIVVADATAAWQTTAVGRTHAVCPEFHIAAFLRRERPLPRKAAMIGCRPRAGIDAHQAASRPDGNALTAVKAGPLRARKTVTTAQSSRPNLFLATPGREPTMNTPLQALPAPRVASRSARRPPALTIATSSAGPAAVGEAALDRRYIRLLLENFCGETDGYRRCGLMRAAIDLYDQLTDRAGAHLSPPPAQAAAIDDLIDLLECTPPAGRLYYSRGLDLIRSLRTELDRQDALAGNEAPLADDDARHAMRGRTMARAQMLLAPVSAAA